MVILLFVSNVYGRRPSRRVLTNIYRLTGLKARTEPIWESVCGGGAYFYRHRLGRRSSLSHCDLFSARFGRQGRHRPSRPSRTVFSAVPPRTARGGSQHIDVCCGVRSVCVCARAPPAKASPQQCVYLCSWSQQIVCSFCCLSKCVRVRSTRCDSSQSVVYAAALQMWMEPKRWRVHLDKKNKG